METYNTRDYDEIDKTWYQKKNVVETCKTVVVYKYEVKCCNLWVQVDLPKGAKILSAVPKQPSKVGDGILIYAEIDPKQDLCETFNFLAAGTGHVFTFDVDMLFLNTVQIPSPINEVYHVYYARL